MKFTTHWFLIFPDPPFLLVSVSWCYSEVDFNLHGFFPSPLITEKIHFTILQAQRFTFKLNHIKRWTSLWLSQELLPLVVRYAMFSHQCVFNGFQQSQNHECFGRDSWMAYYFVYTGRPLEGKKGKKCDTASWLDWFIHRVQTYTLLVEDYWLSSIH